ncbi:hypothetical protein [Ideonella livida]|uniref:Tail tube protein n=1 Tax=Ideonella livida TaxID=2707176 RepID=A0A7C9PEF7_9BURK|nr:hypothetical protein [Ideonella livida]NDY89695.1 hypothetical protein [Ideonella livida]
MSFDLSRAMRAIASTGTKKAALDGVSKDVALDDAAVGASAQNFAVQSVRVNAAAAVHAWIDSDNELGANEGSADRLKMLLVGFADQDKNGELSDDEQAVYLAGGDAAWAYMAGLGVSEDDLDLIFNGEDPDEANAAGDRVIAFLSDSLASGEEAELTAMDDFAFGEEATASALDAAYKTVVAFRGGKKVAIRKRISGAVRLSAAQKLALRKAQAKAHGARATMARMKSMRARQAAGR